MQYALYYYLLGSQYLIVLLFMIINKHNLNFAEINSLLYSLYLLSIIIN